MPAHCQMSCIPPGGELVASPHCLDSAKHYTKIVSTTDTHVEDCLTVCVVSKERLARVRVERAVQGGRGRDGDVERGGVRRETPRRHVRSQNPQNQDSHLNTRRHTTYLRV